MAQFLAKIELRYVKHLVRLVLFALLLPCLLVFSQSCGSSYSQRNFKLEGHAIRTLSSSTSDVCLSKCALEPNCSSINFEENSKKCELNKANHLSHPESLTAMFGSGWEYLNYHRRPPAYCSDKLCGGTKLCLLKNGGEDYECKGCEDALGMEDGRIPDSSLTASKNNWFYYNASYGRLRSTNWTFKYAASEFLIDLGKEMMITKIATQGCNWGASQGYVGKYTLDHSTDNTTWVEYRRNGTDILKANSDGFTVVTNSLQPKIKTRFVQMMVRQWTNDLFLRVELYGCSIP